MSSEPQKTSPFGSLPHNIATSFQGSFTSPPQREQGKLRGKMKDPGKEVENIAPKSVPHAQHDNFSANHIIALWRCPCRRHVLNSRFIVKYRTEDVLSYLVDNKFIQWPSANHPLNTWGENFKQEIKVYYIFLAVTKLSRITELCSMKSCPDHPTHWSYHSKEIC